MPEIKPYPKYQTVTEAEVLAALEDPNENNPIAIEVARLLEGYTLNVQKQAARTGKFPSNILHIKPRWPIEAVAMKLMGDIIRSEAKKLFN